MAALDFPASPLIGDKYPVPAVVGQPQYTWDGNKWTTVGAQVTTAPPATALPLMDAAAAVVGTATKYAREDHVHPRFPTVPFDAMAYSGMQINGSMEVSQELGTAGSGVTNTTVYIVDGWAVSSGGVQTLSCSPQPAPATLGFSYALAISVPVANAVPGANDYAMLSQKIEGYRVSRLAWGTANAQPITIGFWVFANRAGMYSGALNNDVPDRSYPFTFTVNTANTFEFKTVTIPGDTAGTWQRTTSIGIRLIFAMMCGSAFQKPAGAWAAGTAFGATGTINGVSATSDVMYITGVTVLPGIAAPTAAQSPLIMRPYDQELLTCQRYWQKFGNSLIIQGYGAVGGNIYLTLPLSPYMRVPPTATKIGTWIVGNCQQPLINGTWNNILGLTAVLTATAVAISYPTGSDGVTLDARL